MFARAQALSSATNQGAQAGSVLEGAYGSISGQAGNTSTGVTQNQLLGNEVFAANAQYAAGSSRAATGQAFQSLGGSILNNQQQLTNVGSYLFGQ